MGLIIKNGYFDLDLNKNECPSINTVYLKIMEELSTNYIKLINVEKSEKEYQEKTYQNLKLKNGIIKEQESVYKKIASLLEEKLNLYNLEVSSEMQINLNKVNLQLEDLIRRQARNELKIKQSMYTIKRIPSLRNENIDKKTKLKEQIQEIKELVMEEFNRINWNALIKQTNCFKIEDFSYIKDKQMQKEVFNTFYLNFELEKNLIQYIKNYSIELINNGEQKKSFNEMKIISVSIDIINKIYVLIGKIASYKDSDYIMFLETLKEIIKNLNLLYTKKEIKPTKNDIIKLRSITELNKNKILFKHKVTFLFKKEIENNLDTYDQINSIINLLEDYSNQIRPKQLQKELI